MPGLRVPVAVQRGLGLIAATWEVRRSLRTSPFGASPGAVD
jgi:uncharacterized membrane protein YqjE